MIEALAGFLGRTLLMTGRKTRQHQGAGGDNDGLTHQNLFNGQDRRNEARQARLQQSGHVCVCAERAPILPGWVIQTGRVIRRGGCEP
jgi:hypothetical protein